MMIYLTYPVMNTIAVSWEQVMIESFVLVSSIMVAISMGWFIHEESKHIGTKRHL